MRSSVLSQLSLAIWLVGLFVSLLSPVPARAQTEPPTAQPNGQPLSDQRKEDFHNKMLRVPLPGSGCFEAKYPDPIWKAVQCKPPPKPPSPLARGVRTTNVGYGNDQFAQVMTGNISSASGSFDSATGVTAVSSPIYQHPPNTVYPNTYSLQLNANEFHTPACGGVSGCMAWQQFIFSQSGCETACVYIEYWLFGTSSCPSGWTSYVDPSNNTESGCYLNTPATEVPTPSIADFGKLKLTGAANSGGLDVVTLQTADGTLHAANYSATTLDLAQAWSGAEFNVFGDCCAYEAFFNSGSNLTVRLSTTNGSTNAPNCTSPSTGTTFDGTTAETNNLDLIGLCSTLGGLDPAIVFKEGGGGDPSQYGYKK